MFYLRLALILVSASSTIATAQTAFGGWEEATVASGRAAKFSAPAMARALAVVNTCMYDAWSAYDEHAIGTELSAALQRPAVEGSINNKEQAVSYAAYRALLDLFPSENDSLLRSRMHNLGYDPDDRSTDIETPTGIGNVACLAVLEFRHHDEANQLGDMSTKSGSLASPYEDWSGYRSVNSPGTVPVDRPFSKSFDADRWQPLIYTDTAGTLMVQKFAAVQWCFVTPFAMEKGDDFYAALAPGPFKFGSDGYLRQAEELLNLSANLTDKEKMISEYWADGPHTVQPPGHWIQFAEWISTRDHHSLDDDVKMFFVLSNAMLDASIAAWDEKRTYDSVRPVTAIEMLYGGQPIRAWGGPGKGTVEMDGSQWIPYQPATSPTPPFPDFVSGHSTFSAAAARILQLWTGSDRFGYSVSLPKGSSKIEPGITPAQPVTLKWDTFTAAADEAGMSRRYGGIHFAPADLAGRKLGRLVADKAWAKAQSYFDGSAVSHHPSSLASTN